MKMLNDILSQKKITPEFENSLLTKYSEVFKENQSTDEKYAWRHMQTRDFIIDILANRYFMEHQDAKSFLLNNRLSDLQYNPNSDLVAKVQAFYKKPNKTALEKYITKSFDNVGDVDSFFNIIYGDRAMRTGDFQKALSFYQKSKTSKVFQELKPCMMIREITIRDWLFTNPESMTGLAIFRHWYSEEING